MIVSLSQLRSDMYRLLDRVLSTGRPLQVEYKGRLLKIVPMISGTKMERLIRRKAMRGPPEKLVHANWSSCWKPGLE